MHSTPHVTIIILNWNGWRDTIECLESVLKLDYPNYNVFLIDNHSDDDSVEQIKNWAEGKSKIDLVSKYPDLVYPEVPKPLQYTTLSINSGECDYNELINHPNKLTLFLNDTNSGFAGANNLGIKIALAVFNNDYIFLLNNDTVISPNTLNRLIEVMDSNSYIAAAQAVVYYYTQPNKIANAGGMILPWGQTKYFKKIRPDEIKQISFVNGCALCLRRETVERFGILSEDFFHGEEDFELSMRLKRYGQKMVCIGGSAVYHKIGSTAHHLLQRQIGNKVLLFAINRLVDMKRFYSHYVWLIWRELALTYFYLLLTLRYRVPFSKAAAIISQARRLSGRLSQVNKSTVEQILIGQSIE